MNNIITTTGRNINTITAEIVTISNQAAQMVYMSMVEIGRRLVEAKSMVDHGEWGDYLKNEVQFSQRTANNFMRVYERSQDGSNSQTFANLSYSKVVKLLALPEGELEEFAQNHDLEHMSVRELDKAIKERDEEKRLRQEAEEKADRSAKAAEFAQGAADRLQKQNERLKKELKDAEEAEALAQKNVRALQEHPRIPDAMKEKIESDARAKAEQEVRTEFQTKLDAARTEVQRLEAECAAMKQSEPDRKRELMADPDLMAIDLLGKQIQDALNRLEGYRMKVVGKNPGLEPALNSYITKLTQKIINKLGGEHHGIERTD